MVSSAVSPFLADEACTSKPSTSAPSRVAASWKELRVRVEGSKNSVQTVRPARRVRSAGAAMRLRAASPRRRPAATPACDRGRPSSVSRWRSRPSARGCCGWRRQCGMGQSGGRAIRECGSASQRSRMIAAASASSCAAWWRLRCAAGAAGGEALRGLDRTGAFVDLLDRQVVARGQRAGEARARIVRIGWSPPSSVAGSPTTSRSGAIRASSGPGVGQSGAGVAHVEHADFARAHGNGIADRHADAAGADVEGEQGQRLRGFGLQGVADRRRTAAEMSTPSERAAACQRSSSGVSKQIAWSAGTVSQAFCAELVFQLPGGPAGVAEGDQEMRAGLRRAPSASGCRARC